MNSISKLISKIRSVHFLSLFSYFLPTKKAAKQIGMVVRFIVQGDLDKNISLTKSLINISLVVIFSNGSFFGRVDFRNFKLERNLEIQM